MHPSGYISNTTAVRSKEICLSNTIWDKVTRAIKKSFIIVKFGLEREKAVYRK